MNRSPFVSSAGQASTSSTGTRASNGWDALVALIGTGAATAQAAIQGGNTTAQTQIVADAQRRIEELRQQAAASSGATQDAINNRIDAIQQALANTNHGLSTGAIIGIAVGAAALVGGLVFIAARPRRNPVIYGHRKGHVGLQPLRYVPSWKL